MAFVNENDDTGFPECVDSIHGYRMGNIPPVWLKKSHELNNVTNNITNNTVSHSKNSH